jgi:endonuclease YncB( thermonuclease family)
MHISFISKKIMRFLALIFVFGISVAAAENISGKVVGVVDGDTIKILDSRKTLRRIRFAGIDAPEKDQPFGNRAKQHLSDLIFGMQVEVITNKIDKFGRPVGKVLLNGEDVNLEQIRAGFAWHYKKYQKEQPESDRALYSVAEINARGSKTGLWAGTSPIPPWEWRHGEKNETRPGVTQSGCPCDGIAWCTGPRGGKYCFKANGKKQY